MFILVYILCISFISLNNNVPNKLFSGNITCAQVIVNKIHIRRSHPQDAYIVKCICKLKLSTKHVLEAVRRVVCQKMCSSNKFVCTKTVRWPLPWCLQLDSVNTIAKNRTTAFHHLHRSHTGLQYSVTGRSWERIDTSVCEIRLTCILSTWVV